MANPESRALCEDDIPGASLGIDYRATYVYGIGNGTTCAIVPHSNAPETFP